MKFDWPNAVVKEGATLSLLPGAGFGMLGALGGRSAAVEVTDAPSCFQDHRRVGLRRAPRVDRA
eukprot:15485255-Alexandrium_andersonii.AAC.1